MIALIMQVHVYAGVNAIHGFDGCLSLMQVQVVNTCNNKTSSMALPAAPVTSTRMGAGAIV